MSVVIPPGFGQAAFRFTGQPGTPEFITTIGIDLTAAGGDFAAAAQRISDCWEGTLGNKLLKQYTFTGVQLAVGQDGGGQGSVEVAANHVGPVDDDSEAIAMAPILRKITGGLGRAARGRMFVPGVLGAFRVDASGDLGQTFLTELDSAAGLFFDALNGANAGPLDPSPLPPVLLHSAGPPTPILELKFAKKVGWIRKRIR